MESTNFREVLLGEQLKQSAISVGCYKTQCAQNTWCRSKQMDSTEKAGSESACFFLVHMCSFYSVASKLLNLKIHSMCRNVSLRKSRALLKSMGMLPSQKIKKMQSEKLKKS